MLRKRYRFLWDEKSCSFQGSVLDAEPSEFRLAAQTINTVIAEKCRSQKAHLVKLVLYFLAITIIGYTASYILLTNKQNKSGTSLLIITPLGAFIAVTFSMTRRGRTYQINNYLKTKSIDFQSMVRPHGYVVDFTFFESRIQIIVARPHHLRRGFCQCKKVEFTGIIEYVELKSAITQQQEPKSQSFKTCPKEDNKKSSSATSGFFIKKILKDDKIIIREDLQQESGDVNKPIRFGAMTEDNPDWRGLLSSVRQRDNEYQLKTILSSNNDIDQEIDQQQRSTSSLFESRLLIKPSTTIIQEPRSTKTIILGSNEILGPKSTSSILKLAEANLAYDRTSQNGDSPTNEISMQKKSFE